jgi:hypothetical protein
MLEMLVCAVFAVPGSAPTVLDLWDKEFMAVGFGFLLFARYCETLPDLLSSMLR